MDDGITFKVFNRSAKAELWAWNTLLASMDVYFSFNSSCCNLIILAILNISILPHSNLAAAQKWQAFFISCRTTVNAIEIYSKLTLPYRVVIYAKNTCFPTGLEKRQFSTLGICNGHYWHEFERSSNGKYPPVPYLDRCKWKYLQAKMYFVFESLIWAAVIETLLWKNTKCNAKNYYALIVQEPEVAIGIMNKGPPMHRFYMQKWMENPNWCHVPIFFRLSIQMPVIHMNTSNEFSKRKKIKKWTSLSVFDSQTLTSCKSMLANTQMNAIKPTSVISCKPGMRSPWNTFFGEISDKNIEI